MDLDQFAFVSSDLPDNHRSGFVALVGKPNVGKSTLLNLWLEARLMAVSPKPQTTRHALRGILTRPDAQVIFVDTPGIHRARTKLGDYMVDEATRAIPDADVLLFMVDGSMAPQKPDEYVAELLNKASGATIILVMNKADMAAPDRLLANREAYEALGTWHKTVIISASEALGTQDLLNDVVAQLPLGPRYYPEDQISDQQERFVAGELIREALMRQLDKEVPHASAVLVQEFDVRETGVLHIAATIFVERDSQKGIVIGRQGSMLKNVGKQARGLLQEFFDTRVYLELWVKVRKNWRRDERSLRQFGYTRE